MTVKEYEIFNIGREISHSCRSWKEKGISIHDLYNINFKKLKSNKGHK